MAPRTMSSWTCSAPAMSVGASSHHRVESSMSVKRNVTVPLGRPSDMAEPYFIRNRYCCRDVSATTGTTGRGGGSFMGEVMNRVLGALNAHDLDAFVACFAKDYRSEQPAHPDRAFQGSDKVRENWASVFSGVP